MLSIFLYGVVPLSPARLEGWVPRKRSGDSYGSKFKGEIHTLPETKMYPENGPKPKWKVVFQPSIFRCELLVSGGVSTTENEHVLNKKYIFQPLISGDIRSFSGEYINGIREM